MALTFPRPEKMLEQIRSSYRHYLWQQDLAALPFWKRFLLRSSQIATAVARDLFEGELSLRATSLVYTTIIGFFPLFALSFAVLKSLGAHNAIEPALLTLLQPLGERSTEITAQILSYVDELRVDLLGITSVVILLFIVLGMMRKIETSFNYIWSVKRARSWSSRIREYLFAVIVSPLLLFLSISITSSVNTNYFERFLENLSYGSFIIELTALLAPIVLMSLAFAFAYSFLPNTRVHFSSAIIGGFVTTLIWKMMGSVFQEIFIASARDSIYLAFATAIAILFFAYVGWLVALIGSSIAFYHQYPARARTGREKVVLGISQQEEICLALAATIIHRFHQGMDPLDEDQLAAALNSNTLVIEDGLQALQTIGLISKTADDPVRYLPNKSVNDCTLVDIWRAIRSHRAEIYSGQSASAALIEIKQFESQLEAVVERELGQIKFVDGSIKLTHESTGEH